MRFSQQNSCELISSETDVLRSKAMWKQFLVFAIVLANAYADLNVITQESCEALDTGAAWWDRATYKCFDQYCICWISNEQDSLGPFDTNGYVGNCNDFKYGTLIKFNDEAMIKHFSEALQDKNAATGWKFWIDQSTPFGNGGKCRYYEYLGNGEGTIKEDCSKNLAPYCQYPDGPPTCSLRTNPDTKYYYGDRKILYTPLRDGRIPLNFTAKQIIDTQTHVFVCEGDGGWNLDAIECPSSCMLDNFFPNLHHWKRLPPDVCWIEVNLRAALEIETGNWLGRRFSINLYDLLPTDSSIQANSYKLCFHADTRPDQNMAYFNSKIAGQWKTQQPSNDPLTAYAIDWDKRINMKIIVQDETFRMFVNGQLMKTLSFNQLSLYGFNRADMKSIAVNVDVLDVPEIRACSALIPVDATSANDLVNNLAQLQGYPVNLLGPLEVFKPQPSIQYVGSKANPVVECAAGSVVFFGEYQKLMNDAIRDLQAGKSFELSKVLDMAVESEIACLPLGWHGINAKGLIEVKYAACVDSEKLESLAALGK